MFAMSVFVMLHEEPYSKPCFTPSPLHSLGNFVESFSPIPTKREFPGEEASRIGCLFDYVFFSIVFNSWFKKGSSDCRGILEKAASSNVTSSAMSFSKTALSMSRRFLTYHVWMAGSAIKGLKRDLYIYT